MLFGAVEAGGTKVLCAVGSSPGEIQAETRFATTSPDETLDRAVAFLREQAARHGALGAIGIASFGPLDLDPRSPTYGHLTTTPKAGWSGVDLVGRLRAAFRVPVAIDTDVNAAALAEWRLGAAQGLDTVVYVTVGTGIGGGAVVHGRPLHGSVHPEMGHVLVPHDMAADPFPGLCPFHADCLEGLASGPAIAARWGQPAETLPAAHPAWPLEAHYLAMALHGITCMLSPQRVVLGGGVMTQPALLPMVRTELVRLMAGYVQAPSIGADVGRYVVPPGLGSRSGVVGALVLAARAASEDA